MSRKEFTKSTKRAALKRAGNGDSGNATCEATGDWYGLPAGQRCTAALANGVEFDHIDLDANSKDNSLENCCACCPKCHRYKTTKHDIPLAAKTLRQQDKARGIRTKSRGFPKPPPASSATGPLAAWSAHDPYSLCPARALVCVVHYPALVGSVCVLGGR
jgi:hypothetical protein